jgi:hypothetical protein
VSGEAPRERRGAAASIDDLLREARAARLAMHDLIDRLHCERSEWERDRSQLLHRSRLTHGQRQRLRDSVDRPRRR